MQSEKEKFSQRLNEALNDMNYPPMGHGRQSALAKELKLSPQIIGRWLRGETYDQIALHTHHRPVSIQRYIQTFVRLVKLHTQGFSENEIGLLLQLSPALVREYLAVYGQHDTPDCRERLQDQLRRLDASPAAKRGA